MTDDDAILLCAFRYCLGRKTYVVAECAGWLRSRWPTLGNAVRGIILGEIGRALDADAARPGKIGMDMDREVWRGLFGELSARDRAP